MPRQPKIRRPKSLRKIDVRKTDRIERDFRTPTFNQQQTGGPFFIRIFAQIDRDYWDTLFEQFHVNNTLRRHIYKGEL